MIKCDQELKDKQRTRLKQIFIHKERYKYIQKDEEGGCGPGGVNWKISGSIPPGYMSK